MDDHPARDRVRRRHLVAFGLLAGSALGLAAGAAAHAAAAAGAGDALWLATGALGAGYSLATLIGGLRAGQVGVDVIALLALVGAMAVGEVLAAGVIALMLASGRSLEAWAAGRAHRDLRALLQRAPRTAHRHAAGGGIETVDVAAVVPGDLVLVAAGEVVPADGTLQAAAVLDESALTGESLPVERQAGDAVRSGVVNAGQPVDLRVTAAAADSTYAGVVRLVAEAESEQAPFVRLADRYAAVFVAVSLAGAAGAWLAAGPSRAVAVLVVATPCPLILAAPVALVAGLSLAARRGIVMKGGGVLERLAGCTTVLVDKTGTLTAGTPVIADVVTADGTDATTVLGLAASLDQLSPHVLATAIVRAATERGCRLSLPTAVEEVAGQGIRGTVDGRHVALGKAGWVGATAVPPWARAARRRARLDGTLTVWVGIDGQPAGVLVLDDPVRPDAARTVRALRRSGMRRVVMVTGDRAEVADAVGAVIGVDEVLAERSPADKLDAVRAERRTGATVMVGDGVNDAPALALADVGVAMGARGATASSEAADVVLTVDRLERLADARALAWRSRRIAVESVLAGMGLSAAAMVAAGFGLLPAVWGALLQEAIDVAVIANALRALRPPPGPVRLGGEDARVAARFRHEHVAIRSDIDQLRTVADRLGAVEPAEAMRLVRAAQRVLVEEVAPHEAAEQAQLYPAIDRALGGAEPTGPMSRAHAEIAHQIRRLGQLVDDIGDQPPDAEDVVELRRLLYGLHAVLRLHTAQEDEHYLSLGEDEDEPYASARMRTAVP